MFISLYEGGSKMLCFLRMLQTQTLEGICPKRKRLPPVTSLVVTVLTVWDTVH